MIRNFLYSLFIHAVILIIVYFSFNFSPPVEEEKNNKVAISFVVKSGNSNNAGQGALPILAPATPEVPKEIVPEIKPQKKLPEKPPEKPAAKPLKKPAKPKAKKAPVKKESAKEAKKKLPEPKEIKKEQKKVEEKKSPPQAKDANKIKEPKKKEPEKKPEVKKPEEKKPEIKDPKKEEADEDEADQEDDADDADDEAQSFTANTIESLDLLARDKFNIQNQIRRCYKRALNQERVKNKVVINAHIIVAEDGFIDLSKIIIKDFQKYSDPKEIEFHQAVDVVRQSLKFCSPIKNLPQDKYDVWKEIDLQFDGEE